MANQKNSTGLFEKFGKTYPSGEMIFCENELGSTFYLLQKGTIKIIKVVNHTQKTMDVINPGEFFGEMSVLEGQPRSASAIANEDVSLLELDRNSFKTLLKMKPEIAYKLLDLLSKRIYDARRRLQTLLLPDVEMKIADMFIILAEKEPSYIPNLNRIVLQTTVDELASWCAESPENVGQSIKYWEKMAKIEVSKENITVFNLNDLRRIINAKRKFLEK